MLDGSNPRDCDILEGVGFGCTDGYPELEGISAGLSKVLVALGGTSTELVSAGIDGIPEFGLAAVAVMGGSMLVGNAAMLDCGSIACGGSLP